MYYFSPQTSKQYELINYSEHGTYVDNVLYSCDFSDKINRHVVSSKDLDPSKVSKNKLLAAAQVRQNSKPKGSRRTVGLGVQKIVKACNCTTSSSNLIGGSGAGWEGTALLHHGSYIKLGCAQFVFSITSNATKLPSSGKASSSGDKKPVASWWMLRFFGLCGFYMCYVHLQLQVEFIFHHSIQLFFFCGYRFLKKKCSVENQKISVLFYAASWRKCYVWPLAFSISSVAEIRPPCRAWIEYHLNFYQ